MSSLSEGDLELSSIEHDALRLSGAAVMLDQARLRRRDDPQRLAEALEGNLTLWVEIKTAMLRQDNPLPAALKENLVRLANFVCGSILDGGIDIPETAVDTIVNINLQVSEGLIESRQ